MKGYLLFWKRYLSEIFWKHFWDICILYSIFKIKFTAKPEKSQNFTSFRPEKGQKKFIFRPEKCQKNPETQARISHFPIGVLAELIKLIYRGW